MKGILHAIEQHRVIALLVAAAIVITGLAFALGGTLAAKPDFTVALTAPNSYDTVEKGATAQETITGARRVVSSNSTVATAAINSGDHKIYITGVKAGLATLSIGSSAGLVMGLNYQVTDAANISAYKISNGGEVFLKDVGNTAGSPVTVTTPAGAAAAAAFQGIAWNSLQPDIATVNTAGAITARAKGSAVVVGTFTDKWGVEQNITILVVVGVPSDVMTDDKGNHWVHGDKDNIYYESDEDGNVLFPPHIIYNPDGPGGSNGGKGDQEVFKGDDEAYYIAKPGYPNIWVELDSSTGALGSSTIWGGSNFRPGGGDDRPAVHAADEDIYYISWGQNVFQSVDRYGASAGYGYKSLGQDVYIGGGEDKQPDTADDLTPILLHKDNKFYAGPFTDDDGFQYYIGDKPAAQGGNGELNTAGNGAGGHESLEATDQMYYLNANGDMDPNKPPAKPTVTGVTVDPASVSLYQGSAWQFEATVAGTNNPSQVVTWTLSGNTSMGTIIDANGMLVVALDETAKTLTVKAASALDTTKTGTAAVSIDESKPWMAKSNAKRISTGGQSFIIKDDGTLWGAGSNSRGQLGIGDTKNRYAYVPIMSDASLRFEQVSGYNHSGGHTIALSTDGRVFTFGANDYGKLGDGTTTTSKTPREIKVAGVNKFIFVASGARNSAAIAESGDLYTWGANSYGQIGNGTTSTSVKTPTKITVGTAGTKVKEVSIGDHFMAAMTEDGTLYAWGSNALGQLGNGTTTSRAAPGKVTIGSDWKVKAFSAKSYGHILAVTQSGDLYAWGRNTYGQVGNGTTAQQKTPVQVMPGSSVKFDLVAAGHDNSLAITTDGKLYTWGYNGCGLLGIGSTSSKSTPQWVSQGMTFRAISGSEATSMAVSTDGKLYCWGYNGAGQYGNGTIGNNKWIPQFIPLS
jgi:alpha-tubulin suppressor-like RCC1 family protein